MSENLCLHCPYPGVRGVHRITMAPGIGLLQDGELSTVRAGVLRPLTLPPGSPRPAGPLLWSAPSPGASGAAS